MQTIELAIFDMAGTTINEDNIVYKTVCKVFTDCGYNVNLNMVLEHGAGKEKKQAIKDILLLANGEIKKESEIDELFSNFKKELESAYNEIEVTTYTGVLDLFHYLRENNIRVVLNTGYDSKTANKLLQKLGWQVGKQVDGLITSDDVKIGRPTSEMIDLAMSQFNITDSKKVLKAGDSVIDIEEGKNANCGITVGVLTGAQTREQLQVAEPTYILENLIELKEVI